MLWLGKFWLSIPFLLVSEVWFIFDILSSDIHPNSSNTQWAMYQVWMIKTRKSYHRSRHEKYIIYWYLSLSLSYLTERPVVLRLCSCCKAIVLNNMLFWPTPNDVQCTSQTKTNTCIITPPWSVAGKLTGHLKTPDVHCKHPEHTTKSFSFQKTRKHMKFFFFFFW